MPIVGRLTYIRILVSSLLNVPTRCSVCRGPSWGEEGGAEERRGEGRAHKRKMATEMRRDEERQRARGRI